MLSRNIQADILALISDGKARTLQTIADIVEVHKITVFKHIQALSFNYNIQTFHGGIDKGGVRLIPEPQVSVKGLKADDLQLIISKLSSLQKDNPRIKAFINKLIVQKENKEENL